MQVLLNGLRSVHNVASCFRSADGAGVEKVWLSGFTPDVYDKFGSERIQFTRVSLGAEKSVAWERVDDSAAFLLGLKKLGWQVVAVEQTKTSVNYVDFKPADLGKTIFVFGHEVSGVSDEVLDVCDTHIEIPMHGEKNSLNVSVAFGIITHHFANA